MALNIIRNDISKVTADAIVNTANPEVAYGTGVDRAIYEAAGAEELLAEREKIGPMIPGQAASTPAFALNAKYIIHTVGPVWAGGDHGEAEEVALCYSNSLKLADHLKCESIAFPLIATGNYGFPKDKALDIAMSEISDFLEDHDMDVTLVVYDKESFVVSGKAFADIRSYIEESDVMPAAKGAAGSRRRNIIGRKESQHRPQYKLDESALEVMSSKVPLQESHSVFYDIADYGIPDVQFDPENGFEIKELTFQQMLFKIIDRKELKDSDVYKRANIDRRLFSKIRSDENYKPSKKTVLALCIALKLNLDDTMDLLLRAGYALSPSDRFDLIVTYCINNKIYDIYKVNCILFKFTDQVLCA